VWRGIIEEYRDRMPVTDATPIVTLREGGTPLIHSEHLSELTGCEVHLKFDGANPTGSFKDRGMTDGDHQGQGGRGRGGHLRLDRQHLGAAAAYAAKAGMTAG
jgi:threonine synthase